MLLIIVSCSESDPQPSSYDSLAGSWIFSDPKVSGEIWITETNGTITIDRKGYFSFETFAFAINDEGLISYLLNKEEELEFLRLSSNNSFGSADLYLLDGQINNDYTEIVFNSFVVIRGKSVQDAFDREIIVKRK